jgi:phosphopantothenoylcysteine decarboxylase/phosphopantothenate--cysteine ligase
MLTTTLLATQAPVLIAPAMNVHMYENPIVQENIAKLKRLGYRFIDPGEGQLACGYVGRGRMAEPEEIVERIRDILAEPVTDLSGKRVIVTAGPTREPLDPVRFFTNRSSGKMGYALAEAARGAGAEVVLISGPVSLETPQGVRRVDVGTAAEMLDAVLCELPLADVVIKAAAVADYRPAEVADHKMKKNGEELVVRLERTPDIAEEVGRRKQPHQLLVGFAAETDHVAAYAQDKLKRKNMDLIVANDVTQPGAGFEGDTNIVTVYDREGEVLRLPMLSKREVARRLIGLIGERLHAR